MVMQDFDADAGVAATRANTTITTVRMGCSVSHQYGRRRTPRAMESLYESRFEEVQNMADFKGQCDDHGLWFVGVAQCAGVLRLNDDNPRLP